MNDVVDRCKVEGNDNAEEHAGQLLSLQQQSERLQLGNASLRRSTQLYRVDALLRRAADCRPALAQRLFAKAEQLLAEIDSASAAGVASPPIAGNGAESTPSLLAQLITQLQQKSISTDEDQEPATFEALLRRQEVEALQQADDVDAVANLDAIAPAGELKVLQQFREDWAKRSTEKAVAKALEEAPEDAGPLNAHRLIVRALETMQDVSPEYLGRFVNYIESLLWLEQAAIRSLPRKDDKSKRRR